MSDDSGDKAVADAKAARGMGFLGSLKDALLAAGRDEMPSSPARFAAQPAAAASVTPPPLAPLAAAGVAAQQLAIAEAPPAASPKSPSAEDVARMARSLPVARAVPSAVADSDAIPTTRVVRGEPKAAAAPARTQLVRGKKQIDRGSFAQDPVVGFLVVVGGPGLGAFRPVFEGNNTIGRAASNRVPLDFGDDAISSEAQAYIRYDSSERSFLFVPNLAKTNVVSVNDKKPTGAVDLKPMDVITLGRTQVAFLAFCGSKFDWSEIAEA